MSSAATSHHDYVLGRSSEEYERLRAQARVWEAATARLLDRVAVGVGARCLDAGCGPGETMRLLAQRVGPTGRVQGVDIDEALGRQALAMLHADGQRQCDFAVADLEDGTPIAGGTYDVVYARLLLFHVADPIRVLRLLWRAVAPGGHLIVHDYDLGSTDVQPELATMQEWKRVALGAFALAGRDIRIGLRLPSFFASAGVGAPDGTDVTGRLDTLGAGAAMVTAVYRSLLPAATSYGLISGDDGERWLTEFAADVAAHGDDPLLWPLLVGAWKQKTAESQVRSRGSSA